MSSALRWGREQLRVSLPDVIRASTIGKYKQRLTCWCTFNFSARSHQWRKRSQPHEFASICAFFEL